MDSLGSIWPWILDFVLRERVDSEWAKGVIATIPPSFLSIALDVDPTVKKSLLLRSLENDLQRGFLNLGTLRTLELIEEIDRPDGNDYLMSLAYWAVAAHCTAQCKEGDNGAGDFKDLVDRLWRDRVGDLMQSGSKIGLLSTNLYEWYECLVTPTAADPKTRDRVLRSITVEKTVGKAKDLLGQYLREARRVRRPSFIQRQYEKACKAELDELVSRTEVGAVLGDCKNGADAGASSGFLSADNEDYTASVEDVRISVDASTDIPSSARVGGHEGEKTAPVLQKEAERPEERCKDGSGPFFSSVAGARTVDYGAHSPTAKIGGTDDGLTDVGVKISRGRRRGWDNNSDIATPDKRPKWKKVVLVDLPKHKTGTRRSPRKWGADEECTLIEAVKRFGKGEWRKILDVNRSVFSGRTEVDLKDKWRNMIKPKKRQSQQRLHSSEI